RRRRRARHRLRRCALASGDRADSAGTTAHAARRRGARGGGDDHPLDGPLRRLRRADRRASLHGHDLRGAVRALERGSFGDGGRRRNRAAPAGCARGGVRRARIVLRGARRRARASALHASFRVPRLARSRCPPLRRPRQGGDMATRSRSMRRWRNPIDRLTEGLPKPWRTTIDWLVTIVGAILIVLAIKQWVINPYRIPSSSMEPTLHCARPGLGCEASFSDRVLACRFCYDLWSPKRGDIIV